MLKKIDINFNMFTYKVNMSFKLREQINEITAQISKLEKERNELQQRLEFIPFYELVIGNIMDTPAQVIVHQCHCYHTNGSAKGLALTIFSKYPLANVYKDRTESSNPGTIVLKKTGVSGKYICNMFAQYYSTKASTRNEDTSTNRVMWFKQCLEKLGNIKGIKSVSFPYCIGCGLAGGNWSIYEKLINDFAKTYQYINVSVYKLSSCNDEKQKQPILSKEE